MDVYLEASTPVDQTLPARMFLGKRLIAKNGAVIGKITTINIDPIQMTVAGVYVRRRFKKIYVSSSYFAQMTKDAVVLSVDPSLLWLGTRVLTYDGELVGKVKAIERKEDTNTITSLTVRGFMRGTFSIPIDQVSAFGDNIVLKKTYNAPKRTFWNSNV